MLFDLYYFIFFKIDYSKNISADIIIGISAIIIGIFVFTRYYKVNCEDYIISWEKVKKAELRENDNK